MLHDTGHTAALCPELTACLERHILGPEVAPGAVLHIAVYRSGWRWASAAVGVRSPSSQARVSTATPYDLASLTKSLTAIAIGRMVERDQLAWNTQLQECGIGQGTAVASATIEALAGHRSGLRAHIALYDALERGEAVSREDTMLRIFQARQTLADGSFRTQAEYSDLGYILLGQVLGQRGRCSLSDWQRQDLLRPLQLDIDTAEAWRSRDPRFEQRVAPTETIAWRGGELVGIVHDENAWLLSAQEQSGHAGLFGTAGAVAKLGRELVDCVHSRSARLLQSRTLARMLRDPGDGATLRMGFDSKANSDSSAGRLFGENSFGHLGFTGTSLWCDPDAQVVVALLTNRVCPSREKLGIRTARPAIDDVAFSLNTSSLWS